MDENEERALRDDLERVKRQLREVSLDFIAAKEDLHAMTEKAKRLEQALEVVAQDNESKTAKYARQVLARVLNGPGEGTWLVFAGQVVEERDALREKAERLAQALEVIAQDNEGWTAKYAKQVLAGQHPTEILVELIKGTMKENEK